MLQNAYLTFKWQYFQQKIISWINFQMTKIDGDYDWGMWSHNIAQLNSMRTTQHNAPLPMTFLVIWQNNVIEFY